MEEDNKYVWYAAYGSNLNRERFLCYIQGGKPIGSTRIEKGCRDTTSPIKDVPHNINHQLFFAQKATQWKDGGVCFLGLRESEKLTLGRKYLITKEQFIDIVRQENHNNDIDINLSTVINRQSLKIAEGWYGNILCLGYEDGYPIFTFTCLQDIDTVSFTKPSDEYLTAIINGLKQIYPYSNNDIASYLLTKKGVVGNFSLNELEKLVASNS